MARAQELADWDGFNKRAAASKRAGRLRGIGIATYIEACGNNGPETATVRLERDGGVTVLIGSQSTGQGHATAYAQLVAEHLDLPPERVRVVQGDTDADRDRRRHRRIELDPCRRRFGRPRGQDARRAAQGARRRRARGRAARSRNRRRRGARRRHRPRDFVRRSGRASAGDARTTCAPSNEFGTEQPTYPNGTHIAEVEIDPDTGATAIVNYVVVDDFGVTLNPLLLAGQVHGGAVQGIGQALMEDTVYDPASGQLLTASLMDYALPRAGDAPAFVFETRNVPCKTNPLGVKGAGEAGAIGSCPAVMNAIIDALWRAYRIRHIDMPATPQRVWAAIEDGPRKPNCLMT